MPAPDDGPHGMAAGPYTATAAIEAELRALEGLRDDYREARGVITASWIAVSVLVAGWMVTASTLPLLLAAFFTLLAVHQSRAPGVYPGRGRELDADIADAGHRLRTVQEGDR